MTEDVESRENIESAASKKIKKGITIEFVKPENFRRDQVWFTEKEKNGATKLYSLDQFDKDKVRGNTPFYKWYLEGRFNAIPHINRSLLRDQK